MVNSFCIGSTVTSEQIYKDKEMNSGVICNLGRNDTEQNTPKTWAMDCALLFINHVDLHQLQFFPVIKWK